MKTGFLITARMKSARLPLKLIKKINDREIIRHMIDRIKLAEELDNIIICTSPNPQDAILKNIAKEENINCFLGSEDDVILRLYEAAKEFKLDYVMNITADCPLVAYEYMSVIIKEYRDKKADLIRSFGLPHGLFLYGIDVKALGKVCEIKGSSDTEVWGRYFTDTGMFKVFDLDIPGSHKRSYRMTLDYPEDLEFFEAVFKHFGQDTYKKTVDDIIKYLDENPSVVEINKNCADKFEKRFNQQNKIILRSKNGIKK